MMIEVKITMRVLKHGGKGITNRRIGRKKGTRAIFVPHFFYDLNPVPRTRTPRAVTAH